MLFLNFIRALIITAGCLVVYAAGVWSNFAVAVASLPFALALAFTVGDVVENWIIQKFNSEA